jgi:hypothetical protein
LKRYYIALPYKANFVIQRQQLIDPLLYLTKMYLSQKADRYNDLFYVELLKATLVFLEFLFKMLSLC